MYICASVYIHVYIEYDEQHMRDVFVGGVALLLI